MFDAEAHNSEKQFRERRYKTSEPSEIPSNKHFPDSQTLGPTCRSESDVQNPNSLTETALPALIEVNEDDQDNASELAKAEEHQTSSISRTPPKSPGEDGDATKAEDLRPSQQQRQRQPIPVLTVVSPSPSEDNKKDDIQK